MKKPSECVGCPLYGDGNGFVPDEIVPGAQVDVWLQNPGQNEEVKAVPACGATGDILNDVMLPAAGLSRGQDVSVRNVIRCRYNKSNDLPPESLLKGAIEHCRVHDIETGAKVSIACGSLPWRATQGPGTITDWRGFMHPTKPVIATLHPADLFRNPKMKLPMMMDFAKVRKYLDGTWPSELPGVDVIRFGTDGSDALGLCERFERWVQKATAEAPFVAMDTEFTRETGYLITLGLGYPGSPGVQVWFDGISAVQNARVREALRTLVAAVPSVFQNTMADVPMLERWLGITHGDYKQIHDTMLAHAVLWSEWPHTLEYLASIYGRHPKMKHLSKKGDVSREWVRSYLQTLLQNVQTWQRTPGLCQEENSTEDVSRKEFSLVKEAWENKERVRGASSTATRPLCDLSEEGPSTQVIVGSRSQDREDARAAMLELQCWDRALKRELGSYACVPYTVDELDKIADCVYNWGDVVDTISAWEGLETELRRDPKSRHVYESQSLPLIPIILKRAKKGIRVDQEAVKVQDAKYQALEDQAVKLAWAATGWPINIGSDAQLKKYCYVTRKYPIQLKGKAQTVDGDAVSALRQIVGPSPDLDEEAVSGLGMVAALDRIAQGADPVLEARVIHSAAGQIRSHYIAPLMGVDRVYPSMKIHAQASGRWSITEPPLQQFPDELYALLIPDPDEVWIGWDWDQIELRILAALADDGVYLDAFERGDDVHKYNAAAIFDVALGVVTNEQRQFAKRFVYRLNYGGDPRMAGDIPGAKQLGLTPKQLVVASNRYLLAHPKLAAWRVKVEAEARTSKVSRTFMGRRRRLLGDGRGIVREAYNHPMQGAVADILNTVTIRIAQEVPAATVVYTVHDAAWWALPKVEVQRGELAIQHVLQEAWDVEGRRISIPVKWKTPRVGEE